MTLTPSFSRSIAWTLSGTLVFALSQWAIVAVIAKASGASDLGRFTLAAAIVAPILALTQLQLRAVLATDALFEKRMRDYLTVRTWSTLIMVAATIAVGIISGLDPTMLGVLGAFVLAKAFDSMADILYGYHQRREDMKVIAIGQFINGPLSIALLGGLLVTTGDLVIATAGYAAASAITLAAWAVPISWMRRRHDTEDPRSQQAAIRALIWSALPLGIVMVLAGLAANVPRYVVNDQLGVAALGIFGGIAYIVLVGTNFVGALGQAASPRLAKFAAARDTALFGRLLIQLLAATAMIALTGTLAAAAWGEPLLEWLYRAEFAAEADVLVALMASTILSYPAIILAVAATAARSFRAQLPVFAVVLIVGTIACLTLIPAWGLLGAAAAIALMALVQVLGCAVLVKTAIWGPS